ncbi:PadR family transcriptional regulator [Vagococcus carniphilus]|uniref:PadR family transcriptional regulator n=2 Tax=Vagococcus carniphilus TaxID=218144 RepID=A0A430AZW5_9ENTE|nr:PadR family transcriptional regulator [Vagococcus carniphilus]QNN72974.1 PadR family transcriptional regulator [Vagococcus carniphilus]RSU13620.1 PadR family transcriptional regulator [Vagococcus carniphilus]
MKQTQLLKGVLEGCVLAIINQKPVYGYELVQILRQSGFENMVGGTVYPLLQKLEKKGIIIGETKPSPDGPDRKYYTLSSLGLTALNEFNEEWQSLTKNVHQILKQTGADTIDCSRKIN